MEPSGPPRAAAYVFERERLQRHADSEENDYDCECMASKLLGGPMSLMLNAYVQGDTSR